MPEQDETRVRNSYDVPPCRPSCSPAWGTLFQHARPRGKGASLPSTDGIAPASLFRGGAARRRGSVEGGSGLCLPSSANIDSRSRRPSWASPGGLSASGNALLAGSRRSAVRRRGPTPARAVRGPAIALMRAAQSGRRESRRCLPQITPKTIRRPALLQSNSLAGKKKKQRKKKEESATKVS